MAQAAVEIIEDFHKQMNAEKLSEIMETENAAGELPVGVVLEEVDTRCLSLPFPPDAILPTMRLVFETMGNKVRYSLSDKQVNNITTGTSLPIIYLIAGADFVKYLLSPPKPAVHPSPPTYLHSELSQIRFPPNVQILPDKQLEKKKRDTVAAIKSRQAKIERQRQEAELHEAALRRPEEERLARLAAEAEEERLQKEFEEQLAREEKEKEENYSQFYGRIR
jgi:flagellar biosynthesis GTPase FlhF